MNDSFLMGRTESVGDLDSQLQHLLNRQGLAGNAVHQRGTFEEFHRNERFSVVFADFMDGADIGMVQGGGGLRFTVEAAQSLRVWREPLRKKLQSNEAVQLGV